MERNRETYHLSLVLNNEQGLYEACRAIAKDKGATLSEKEDALSVFVSDLVDQQEYPLLIQEMINVFLAQVDWIDLLDDFMDE